MAIAIEDFDALEQGSVVVWTGTSDGFDVPFFAVQFIEGLHWLSPNGTTYDAEALRDAVDDLHLVYTAVVPEEARA